MIALELELDPETDNVGVIPSSDMTMAQILTGSAALLRYSMVESSIGVEQTLEAIEKMAFNSKFVPGPV